MKKRTDLLIITGVLLILAASALAIFNIITVKNAGEKSAELTDEINAVIPSETQGTPDYKVNPQMDLPTIELEGHTCAGKIEIPALDLTLPVISKYTKSEMKAAPCLYSGSPYTDDMVIAGHNYRTHFRNIGKLNHGDEVIFTDIDGNVFKYKVDVIENLKPTDVENMTAGDWPLTLFTCNRSTTLRIAVRCDKAE